MSEERLKFMGRLQQKEMRAKELELRIDGLRSSIRDLLDPFEEVLHLKCELVASQAVDLATMHIEYKGCIEEIAAIRRALGK